MCFPVERTSQRETKCITLNIPFICIIHMIRYFSCASGYGVAVFAKVAAANTERNARMKSLGVIGGDDYGVLHRHLPFLRAQVE